MYKLSLIFYISILVTLSATKAKGRQKDPFKKYPITIAFAVNDISDVEIYNTWKSKKWHLSQSSILKFKQILNDSYVTKTLDLKPAHLFMKIKLKGVPYKGHLIYMYSSAVFFEPYTDTKTEPFTIRLSKNIDWDNLK